MPALVRNGHSTIMLALAPIRGVTDAIFRTCFSHHFKGCDRALAPFITTVKATFVNLSHLRDILPENNLALPLVPQILGNNADDIVTLARACADLGYTIVNFNLGCPFPQVVNKKRGSGLLPHPEVVEKMLTSIFPRLSCKLSLKMRLGLHSSTESAVLVERLNQFPLLEIIIHARLGKQRYEGNVDMEGFKQCLHASRHPIVYNGDIVSKVSFEKVKALFPTASGFMVGRGLLCNPLLAEQLVGIKNPNPPQKRLHAFCGDLYERYRILLPKGDRAILGRMKGIWFYLANSFENKEELLKKIQRCKTCREYLELMERIFG
ncbi:MAG: tRNA-dihydrouridine synthase family protein [Chitinivibrionales bacterium]|nr:tRNA-dihydrouridine synthase family protein [Chitinivibrionales bacterium]